MGTGQVPVQHVTESCLLEAWHFCTGGSLTPPLGDHNASTADGSQTHEMSGQELLASY